MRACVRACVCVCACVYVCVITLLRILFIGYLNESYMMQLANKIDGDYRVFGKRLRLESSTIDNIEAGNHDDVGRAYVVVQTWKSMTRNPDSYDAYKVLLDAVKTLKKQGLEEFLRKGAWIASIMVTTLRQSGTAMKHVLMPCHI